MAGIRVGFGRSDISPHIKDGTEFRRPLEAAAVVFGQGKNTVGLVSLDLIEIPPPFCATVQRLAGKRLGIAPERILLHTTHTHTAPWDRVNGSGVAIKGLDQVVAAAIEQARKNAQPARMRVGQTDVGSRFSVYRRSDAGPDLGLQTFWVGYRYHNNDDRPDASALANDMRSRWLGKGPAYEPGPEPVWFDRPVDGLVQAMVFEAVDGKPLGAIVRFAAHPHLANHCRDRLYDPDFPAITCDTIMESLKCPCLFLLGPAANIVPKERVTYVVDDARVPRPPFFGPISAFYPTSDSALLAEMRRIGQELGQAALNSLDSAKAEALESTRLVARTIPVPLDPALPPNRAAISRMRAALLPEYESFLRRGGPLRELRSLASRFNWLEWAATKSLVAVTAQERKAGAKTMPLWALSLNATRMAFMHSEVAIETSASLRAATHDPSLWTVSLTGGSLEYVPTAEMVDEGGYEGRSTIVRRDAEQLMREQMVRMLGEVK